MGSIGRHIGWKTRLGVLCCVLALFLSLFAIAGIERSAAHAAEGGQAERNEKLVVRYALDETSTGSGAKLAATKWDKESQDFVADTAADATVQNNVNGNDVGVVASVAQGKVGTALSFTGKAHARAAFHLPADATGMTISLWVKNITTYWGSLIEFWDGTNGGRLGKGTMQGNGGRANEGDPWSANAAAHSVGVMEAGAGWDSFVVTHNNTNNDNGGAYVDNMEADTWYQLIFTVTATEMKAYRNGVLKQTFTEKDRVPDILQSIMKAATNQENGHLGIRLAHDTTGSRADILDELRIYNGAMTEDEVRELYFEYDPAGELPYFVPEYYDATGITYPDLLLGGAESVTDEGGMKKGTMQNGVEYTYTPIAGNATAAQDEQGVEVALSKGELRNSATVKFRRTLALKAETLGYKVDGGNNISIPVPENAGDDILVKVAPGTDLSKIEAGEIAALKFEQDQTENNYKVTFSYDAKTHIALVRCEYTPFPRQAVYYTIRFAEANTETFTSMQITGGVRDMTLTKEDLTENSANVPVYNAAEFSLTVRLALAGGATAENTAEHTYTAADLTAGKLEIKVTSESGTEETYYLVPVQVSSDATLSALSAEGYTWQFDAATTDYTVSVSKGGGLKLFRALTFTPASNKATAAKQYNATENVITVTVTAEDGVTVKTYTIHVEEKDADATLSAITVNGEPLEGFAPDVTEYTVKYTGAVPTIAATATAGAKADVQMRDEAGKKIITVTAEDGTATKTYTVTFVQNSADASLTRLTLNGTEISFTENAATYTAPTGVRLEDIAVVLTVAEGASATYKFEKEESRLIVTVTAEDGVTTAEYTVTVATSAGTFADGVTEDNTPETGGCGAAADGATIAFVAIGLLAGAGLFMRKLRKKH